MTVLIHILVWYKFILDFIFRRKGPLTMSPTPACAFVNNLELGTNEKNNNNEGEGELT